jgi:hypothetical protein
MYSNNHKNQKNSQTNPDQKNKDQHSKLRQSIAKQIRQIDNGIRDIDSNSRRTQTA